MRTIVLGMNGVFRIMQLHLVEGSVTLSHLDILFPSFNRLLEVGVLNLFQSEETD